MRWFVDFISIKRFISKETFANSSGNINYLEINLTKHVKFFKKKSLQTAKLHLHKKEGTPSSKSVSQYLENRVLPKVTYTELPQSKISTGSLVLLSRLIQKCISKCREIIIEKLFINEKNKERELAS